jgi:hypothetical protein
MIQIGCLINHESSMEDIGATDAIIFRPSDKLIDGSVTNKYQYSLSN